MTTSVIPNFGHITKTTIQFESRGKTLLMASWTEIMTSYPLLQNISILRRPRVAIFPDIIKIFTMYIKTIFRDSKKV